MPFDDVGSDPNLGGHRTRNELCEVPMPRSEPVLQGLLQDSGQDRIDDLDADLLSDFAPQTVEDCLPFFQAAAGCDPRLAPSGSRWMTNEKDAPLAIVD